MQDNSQQLNLVNTNNINFINDSIQQVGQLSNAPTNLTNNSNQQLVDVQYINGNFTVVENKSNDLITHHSTSDDLINNNRNNSQINHGQGNNPSLQTMVNQQQAAADVIGDYDFNFDAFDSNVLFNFNDMEFI